MHAYVEEMKAQDGDAFVDKFIVNDDKEKFLKDALEQCEWMYCMKDDGHQHQ